MDVSTSEYGSGCASGWTAYLDPFSSSTAQWDTNLPLDNHVYQRKLGSHANQEYEDEDLSMVSDASSGPPHFQQDEGISSQEITNPKRSKNRKKAKEISRGNFQDFHLLDDTASSKPPQYNAHVHSHHNNDKYFLGHDSSLSQGFSATHCKGKSALKKHFGYFKSSITGKLAKNMSSSN